MKGPDCALRLLVWYGNHRQKLLETSTDQIQISLFVFVFPLQSPSAYLSQCQQSPEFLSYINDAVAYVNISTLFGPNASYFKQQIQEAADSSAFIIPSSDPSVVEGYTVIYNLLINELYDNEAQLELLMTLTSPGTVAVQAAIQHPFSRGRLYINSSDPFQPVVIDPQYYSHFAGRFSFQFKFTLLISLFV